MTPDDLIGRLEDEVAELRAALAHALRCNTALMQMLQGASMAANSPSDSEDFRTATMLMEDAAQSFQSSMTLASDLVWGPDDEAP